MKSLKIAVLDMYNNFPNQGMRCILKILHQLQAEVAVPVTYDVFNVRAEVALPGLDYDIYLSSGGPGSPLPSDEPWETPYFALIDQLLAWNRTHEQKKYVLLICHSFQLVSRHLQVGELSARKSTSFGIFPMHMTEAGQQDPLLGLLPDPFMAVDSRDFQVTNPDEDHLQRLGVQVLAMEKDRPHVPFDRAIMALRFTPEMVGTQFHPEADGEGMLHYMLTTERRQQVIDTHGQQKYDDMVRLLQDPEAIELTERILVPAFLRQSVAALTAVDQPVTL
ncbi:type 1 glutamine amidotransferase [Hymenobacter defluvii]|uniref:GMP synthase n=1 Tax=Hymenobacter defluvii TaxID=2054411 RepID=A0ABS3TCE8_9BACT|nr:GMP synthase [Hymenobacter defluvii]MBO3270868.1 GMP synthase [Hymenobacter defluvii]